MLVVLAHPGQRCARADIAPVGGEALIDPFADAIDAELDRQPVGFPDPLERVNRGTLRVNQDLDHWVLDPVTRVYRALLPEPARQALRRVLANLNAPSVMVNDLLQTEWQAAGVTIVRFAMNSSVGMAGILDPAARLGMPPHSADFGQTLAIAGVGSGPFIMLPVLGPTTARDGAGFLVDVCFRPTTWILGPADQLFFSTIEGGSEGLAARDAHADALELLEDSSVDYYAALRNAYYQNRTAQIWSRRTPPKPARSAPEGGGAVAGLSDHTGPPAETATVGLLDRGEAAEPGAIVGSVDAQGSAFEVAGGEIADLSVDGGDERREAVALDH
jgi:phospholipid-binding lipoprotein MlaA